MFTLFKNKSKKSGPLKALSSVFATEERTSDSGFEDSTPRRSPSVPKASSEMSKVQKNRPQYSSKDDLSVLTPGQQQKIQSKVKANPYATIKMWRPITMTSSVSHDDAYRNFSNFDVVLADSKLPATGDLRNESTDLSDTTATGKMINAVVASDAAGDSTGDSVPPDYHHHPSPKTPLRSVKIAESVRTKAVKNGRNYTRQAGQHMDARRTDLGGFRSVRRAESLSLPSSAVTIPLRSRALTLEEHQEQDVTVVPPPRRSRQVPRSSAFTTPDSMNGGTEILADYPHDCPPFISRLSHSLSHDRQRSPERKGRSVMDSSYDVVSAGVSESVKSVLSKTYGPEGFEAAVQDVETMLGQLQATMDTLKMSQTTVSSSGSQFQTARQELQLQTKQFVLEAKSLIAGATGSREILCPHLQDAMHTLARLFLHSQAMMVRMRSAYLAQHVGFEVLKVSASFQRTVAAADTAIGRATTDPHMKYLMRQATHLAGLLSTMLKTLKHLEQA